jgi:hypothetical protein
MLIVAPSALPADRAAALAAILIITIVAAVVTLALGWGITGRPQRGPTEGQHRRPSRPAKTLQKRRNMHAAARHHRCQSAEPQATVHGHDQQQ